MWKDISGYKKLYRASNSGEVYSIRSKKLLKPGVGKNGYEIVVLCYKNKPITKYVHRIIAELFVPKIKNKKIINHLDENKCNNKSSNLQWATYRENMLYGNAIEKLSIIKSMPIEQLTLDNKVIKVWRNPRKAAKKGFNAWHIHSCCNGRAKTHSGFKWRYKK